MLRKVASKVAWVGRTASMVFVLALVMALVLGVATMALGADGNPFLLGKGNAASALTKLTGNVNGAAMQVVNPNAGANDTALSLSVQAGEAPMRVNSATRVANLNADKVDGLSSENLRGAYAMVVAGTPPSFDISRTSGFSSVTRVSTGEYCLEPASGFQVRNRAIAVTVDWNHTQNPEGNASAMVAGECGTNGIKVITERQFVLDGNLNSGSADNIGFHVVVP